MKKKEIKTNNIHNMNGILSLEDVWLYTISINNYN